MKQEKVAFQGERGANSEAAAVGYFGEQFIPLPCQSPSFEDIFDKVALGEADKGIIPVENSLAGSIHRNYDLLLCYNLVIVGEIQHRVAHQLMVLPEVKAKEVQAIYSHPQALAQCEASMKRHFPNIERISTYDTAGSAKMLRQKGLTNAAAIASRRAAEIYEMDILYPDFEDNSENYTRFLIINKTPLPREATVDEGQSEVKTSIVYSVDNLPGSLFKSLAVFALRDIDLTKIESRPAPSKRWQYFFYLDFIGDQHETRCRNALNNLQEIATYLRILGSYPCGV